MDLLNTPLTAECFNSDNQFALMLDGWDTFYSVCPQPSPAEPHPNHDDAHVQAVSQRAVACWNACEGIDTELLEPKMLGDQIAAKQALIEQRERLVHAVSNLTACLRTFRNVPKDDQEWTTIDEGVLQQGFHLLDEFDPEAL